MHPVDIQGHLKKRGINQCQIAGELGVSENAIHLVIYKKMISDRIMKTISEKIGKDCREVFPEYYFSRKRAA